MTESMTPEKAQMLGERALRKLEHDRVELPDAYSNVEEYLYDFYPDLPWDISGLKAALFYMINHSDMSYINDDWNTNHSFSIKAELENALKELIKEELS